MHTIMLNSMPSNSDSTIDKIEPVLSDSQSTEIEGLLVNVFQLTGHKLTPDDPLVVAALVQSKLVRQAGDAAAKSVKESVAKAIAELNEAVRIEREQAANIDKTVSNAFQKITDGAKKVGDNELATLTAKFSRAASDTLESVRKEVTAASPENRRARTLTVVSIALAVGVCLGIVISGATHRQITPEKLRLINNGMLLDAAWPKLSKQVREQIQSTMIPEAK